MCPGCARSQAGAQFDGKVEETVELRSTGTAGGGCPHMDFFPTDPPRAPGDLDRLSKTFVTWFSFDIWARVFKIGTYLFTGLNFYSS
jgi:hypothetical protein